MAREKKATGDAPKKRTSRSKTPVAAAEPIEQQSPANSNAQTLQDTTGSNGGSTSGRMKQAISIGEDDVRRRAYEIWEQRGRQHGKDADDWFRAESEIRGKSA